MWALNRSQHVGEEQLLASSVAYLIEGNDTRLAEQLAFCTVDMISVEHVEDHGGGRVEFTLGVYL